MILIPHCIINNESKSGIDIFQALRTDLVHPAISISNNKFIDKLDNISGHIGETQLYSFH